MFSTYLSRFFRFFPSVASHKRGQGLTEYAVILSLIAIAAIAGTAFFGGAVRSKIGALSAAVAGDNSEMQKGEKHAVSAAREANTAASSVNGMQIDSSEVLDSKTLEGN